MLKRAAKTLKKWFRGIKIKDGGKIIVGILNVAGGGGAWQRFKSKALGIFQGGCAMAGNDSK